MSYKPFIKFNGEEGEYSIASDGPEEVQRDLKELAKMFDPNATHDDEENSPGGIGPENIRESTVTDEIIGDRTINQNITDEYTNTGKLNKLLSFLAKTIKGITGKANWFDEPVKTIEQLNSEIINNDADISTLYRKSQGLQQQIVDNDEDIASLQGKTKSLDNSIGSREHDKCYVLTNGESVTSSLGKLDMKAFNLQNQVNSNDTDIVNIQNVNQQQANILENLSTTVTNNEHDIETKFNGLNNHLAYTDNTVTALTNTVNNNETDIESKVSNLTSRVDGNKDEIARHEDSADHDGRYYTEDEINSLLDAIKGMNYTNPTLMSLKHEIDNLNNIYSTDEERIQEINDVIEQYENADADLLNLINNKAETSALNNLAGTGRTTETVKGNADELTSHKSSDDHDNRYYQKVEVDTKVNVKADKSYVDDELDTKLGKEEVATQTTDGAMSASDKLKLDSLTEEASIDYDEMLGQLNAHKEGSDHDSRYYTETEMDAKILPLTTHKDNSSIHVLKQVGTGYALDNGSSRPTLGDKAVDLSYTTNDTKGATGAYSFAEGNGTIASGDYSHAEGSIATASGQNAHAEGQKTVASEFCSHAEGVSSVAEGRNSHAEGCQNIARTTSVETCTVKTLNEYGSLGDEFQPPQFMIGAPHAEGVMSYVDATAGHAEGINTKVTGIAGHAEGKETTASGNDSHAEGYNTIAEESNAHAEGAGSIATGFISHAEGNNTIASGNSSHAEGRGTTANNYYSHAEGSSTMASGHTSHAEGNDTTASGGNSHAEGKNTTASSSASHAEGYKTTASGQYSHAEGQGSITKVSSRTTITVRKAVNEDGIFSAEESYSQAGIGSAHAEGYVNYINAAAGHVEGINTKVTGVAGHAEGKETTASGDYSHAEGIYVTAYGNCSHAQNRYTTAQGQSQTAIGQYNIPQGTATSKTDTDHAFIIGNGIDKYRKSNALTVNWQGDVKASGEIEDGNGNKLNEINILNNDVGNVNNLNTTSKEVVGAINEQVTQMAKLNNNFLDLLIARELEDLSTDMDAGYWWDTLTDKSKIQTLISATIDTKNRKAILTQSTGRMIFKNTNIGFLSDKVRFFITRTVGDILTIGENTLAGDSAIEVRVNAVTIME